MTADRRIVYRPPLGEGHRRHRLHRMQLSLAPETFDEVRARAVANDRPLTVEAASLIEQALLTPRGR